MSIQVQVQKKPKEWPGILQLRYAVLRAPWKQSMESATDELEACAYNAFVLSDEGEVVACGRLQENENKIGQIRYMAIDPNRQGKGLGKAILLALEKKAQELGLQKIELQARENALEFYQANGYILDEKSFLLWNQIQHYKMSKNLNPEF